MNFARAGGSRCAAGPTAQQEVRNRRRTGCPRRIPRQRCSRLDHWRCSAGGWRLDRALNVGRMPADQIQDRSQWTDRSSKETTMKSVQVNEGSQSLRTLGRTTPGQIVLVLQGGGALGSYQAGVYQALHEAGIEPDWIIGTSIGAINASLIAGNAPQHRLLRLQEFWKRMEQSPVWSFRDVFPGFNEKLSYWSTVTNGIPGFFRPNPLAHAGDSYPLGADSAGYYSTSPLEKTLTELVDFDLVNRCSPRLTVGAAHVRSSQMRYFDSRDGVLGVRHIMASGALPPAFPAVRIDGE